MPSFFFLHGKGLKKREEKNEPGSRLAESVPLFDYIGAFL